MKTRAETLWKRVVEQLQTTMNPGSFSMWIAPLSATGIEENTLVLSAPNRFVADWVERNYHQELSESCQLVANMAYRISGSRLQRAPEAGNPKNNAAADPSTTEDKEDISTLLAADYTFANYVVGPNNQFAATVAEQISAQPGSLYNPLYIYGGTGLGKTHLMQSIGHALHKEKPGTRILYLGANELVNQVITGFAKRNIPALQRRIVRHDLFLLDDIQVLAGKVSTMQFFFEIFNDLHNAGRQIVLTSDVQPNNIDNLEERIKSRFNSGLLAEIGPPELETRYNILRAKIELMLVKQSDAPVRYMQDETVMFVAEQIEENVRELEGALHQLNARAMIDGATIDRAFVTAILAHRFSAGFRTVSGGQILTYISRQFHVSEADLKSRSRYKSLTFPRHIAMFLCRDLAQMSYPDIGKLFNRDHSTAMSGCSKIQSTLDSDSKLRAQIETFRASLKK